MMFHTRNKTLALVLLATAFTGCATQGLQAPPGEIPLTTVAAQGVQIYECRATQGGNPAWAFVAPRADLFDSAGRRIGDHGAGPVWTHLDGSGFAGTVRSRVDAPRPGAIPWLHLSAQPQGPAGAYARVSSVQRINTVGGVAPVDGCGPATLGRRVEMAYQADYVLYTLPR